jgi:ATP-binding cassette, subfamily B (MDR/TAP), member 1
MRQEMEWFDTQQTSQIVSTFVTDCLSFQHAIGEKVSLIIYLISMFISGCIIAFLSGWEMTLVVLAFEPLFIFSLWLVMHNQNRRI